MVLLSSRIRIIRNILCCFTVISLNAAELIKGDEYAGDATFSSPVNKIVRDRVNGILFIGAESSGASVFALSGLPENDKQAHPLAPQTIALNNQDAQNNPLYNQGITFLDIMETTDGRRSPIMVGANDLTRAYLLREYTVFDRMSLYGTDPLLDANNAVTNQIVGIMGYRGGGNSAAIAAVTPNGSSNFGATGSAFNVLTYEQKSENISATDTQPATTKTIYEFGQYSYHPPVPQGASPIAVRIFAPFDYSSSAVAIGSNVVSIANNPAMQWSGVLQRGYVGLTVVGGAGASDGARSILIADVNPVSITLRPFAPASAFDNAGDQIIGGLGSSLPLSVQFFSSMETSTGLTYLIVQGGNGTPETTNNTVYALPVVRACNRYGAIVDPTIHGVLASKNSPVYTFFNGGQPSRFLFRRFVEPATTPADTPRASDPAVQVGGGAILDGAIQSMSVVFDAVIVSVSEAAGYYEPCKTGMFISRSLFDDAGKIKAWTPWQRIGGVAEPVFRTILSTDTANITYFTGNDAQSINSIYRTSWGFGSANGLSEYAAQINSLYPAVHGGVQGLVDVPFNTPGLNNISMIITSSFGSVTLTEVGSAQGNQQCPHTGGYANNATIFQNGTISEPIANDALMLTIQGGVLNDVGPITSSAIGVNTVTQQGYLFVGGSHGLAVLTKPDGSGWSTASGLGPNFSGLTVGMAFQTLGNYTFVRNLIVDGNFLYVISAKRVDRIDLSSSTFAATTIASQESLVFDKNDTILDGIMSGKFGLLATSKGMFRTSNGNDVSAITTDNNKYWTLVPVPAGIVPPQQFLVSSTTGNPTDVARDNGGMIQLLSAYLGSNRARINRFAIKDVSTTPIDDTTMLPIPDEEIEGILSSFLTFNGYRTTFNSDGALLLHAYGRRLLVSPYVKTRGFKNGVEAPLDDANGTLLGQVIRSSTSGSWLVAGDFGVRINE